MKNIIIVLHEQSKGNKKMSMTVSLEETNRIGITYAAEEKLSGEIVLKFGKQLTNINAEAVRDAFESDNYEQMMKRIKERFQGTIFAYELLVDFLKSKQIIPNEA